MGNVQNPLRIRCAAAVMALLLIWGLCPSMARAQTAPPEGFSSVCENARLALFIDRDSAAFCVLDKDTGVYYEAVPVSQIPETTKGIIRTRLLSLVTGSYYDLETKAETEFYTASGEMAASKSIETGLDGFSVTYRMDKGLSFSLQVKLLDHGVSVTIPKESVVETERYVFASFQPVPNFFAGSAQDEGFLLVPDGCGAVISFGNGKSGIYNEPVYGENKAFIYEAWAVSKQTVHLPVYGIQKNGAAVLAIITEGAPQARINASVSGSGTPLSRAGASFVVREKDEQHITDDAFQVVIQPGSAPDSDLSVTFLPGTGEQTGYAGMAQLYREHLVRGGMQATVAQPAVAVSLYGAVKAKQYLFGIPLYDKAAVLTDSSTALRILREVQEAAGTSVSAVLHEWDRNAVLGYLPNSFQAVDAGGYAALLQGCEQSGIPVYLSRRNATFEKQGKGISQNADAVRNLAGELSAQYRYTLAGNVADFSAPVHYFTNANDAMRQHTPYLQSLSGMGLAGLYMEDITALTYADYHRGSEMSETATVGMFEGLLRETAQQTGLIVNGGFAYALQSAQVVLNAPAYSSGFLYTDAAVPFYQMALSGLRGYTTSPVNASANPRDTLLKALETGAALHYQFVGGDAGGLISTRLSGLFGVVYTDMRDEALAQIARFAPDIAKVAGRQLLGHRQLAPNVFESVFEGGVTVTVNYGQTAYHAAGGEVPAGGYLLTGGGA